MARLADHLVGTSTALCTDICPGDALSPPPPPENFAPTAGDDPYQDPRSSEVARRQKAAFLETGEVIDVFGAPPCVIPHVP
jgi:hypothetical protein